MSERMLVAGRNFIIPVPPRMVQRNIVDRHDIMQKWHRIATRAGKNTPEYESWQRRVDRFLSDIEGAIYNMGHNQWDHTAAGRKPKEIV